MKIAACLIVKNEEKNLARCLGALEDLDEIVVLDTGSEDGTVDVARKFTSKVRVFFDEEALFHFAWARNEALKDVESPWVLSIDADEVLRKGSVWAFRQAVAKLGVHGYKVTFELEPPNPGARRPKTTKLRFFRKGYFGWYGRIHEQLLQTKTGVRVERLPEAVIEHHPAADQKERNAQNFELLKVSVEEDPGHLPAWKHLGLEHMLRKEWKEAIPLLSHYVAYTADPPLEISEVMIQLGRALAASGDIEKALGTFEKASKIAPNRREPWFQGATELIKIGQIPMAKEWLQTCVAIPESRKPAFHLNSEAVWGNLPQESLDWCETQLAEMKKKAKEKGLPWPG